MDRMDFTQSVVRTKVLEKRLLQRTIIERMIDAKHIDEVFRILGETEYSNQLGKVERPEDYDLVLSAELDRVYALMQELSPDSRVIDLLLLKYDYHNLKVMVKENILDKDFSHLYVDRGTMDIQAVKADFLSEQSNDIQKEFAVALKDVLDDYEETKDPQRIDLILDKYYFEHLYALAKETEIDLFVAYVVDLIDFTNIRTLIRLKKQNKSNRFLEEVLLPHGKIDRETIVLSLTDGIDNIINKFKNYDISPILKQGLEDYEETGSLSHYEKYMDNHLMDLNRSSKNVHFGPEPLFSYALAKETEISILRIIMVSKINNIPPDAIRERLRDLYV